MTMATLLPVGNAICLSLIHGRRGNIPVSVLVAFQKRDVNLEVRYRA